VEVTHVSCYLRTKDSGAENKSPEAERDLTQLFTPEKMEPDGRPKTPPKAVKGGPAGSSPFQDLEAPLRKRPAASRAG